MTDTKKLGNIIDDMGLKKAGLQKNWEFHVRTFHKR